MAKEHDDLIDAAKAAPDIETALENTFKEIFGRWNDAVAREDHVKARAMMLQLTTDHMALVDAVMDHPRVFKPIPVPPRAERFSSTPKEAIKEPVEPVKPVKAEPTKPEPAPTKPAFSSKA